MTFDTLIRNADILTPEGSQPRDLALLGGKIAALLPRGEGSARDEIDATGRVVLPGAIDIHCHIRAPAFPERGTVASETSAAAAGGVTTLFEMPITRPCCNSPELVEVRRAHFGLHAKVNFGLYAAPGRLDPWFISALVDSGIVAFKVFTTQTPPGREDEFSGLCVPEAADQLLVLRALAPTGLPVVVHAEHAGLLAHYDKLARHLDPRDARTHNAARPPLCEALAVAQLLTLNMEAQARLHIAHVTSRQTVDVLRRFAGTSDFSAETCPHYLTRTEEDVARVGVYGKINPPVRFEADQTALWEALVDGTIKHVTTDHASFAAAEKAAADGNFLTAPPGVPGLEILLPTMLDAAASNRLTLSDAIALVTSNGADRFGLAPAKGRIRPGADADLVIADLAAVTKIAAPRLFTHARESARLYDGAMFRGRIDRTIVGGHTIYSGGKVATGSVEGKFVPGCPQNKGLAA